MIVYLNSDFIVHAENVEGYIEAESSFFDFICPEIFPSYRFIPNGHSWERADGKVFNGEAIMLLDNGFETARKQREYEQAMIARLKTTQAELADADAALHELGIEWEEEANE